MSLKICSWNSFLNENELFPDNIHPVLTFTPPRNLNIFKNDIIRVTISGTDKYDGTHLVQKKNVKIRRNTISITLLSLWKGYTYELGTVTILDGSHGSQCISQYKNCINISDPKYHEYIRRVYSDYNRRSRPVPLSSNKKIPNIP